MNTELKQIVSNSQYDNFDINKAITFFTPTYNRSKLLFRIYNCLLYQTTNKFVWIIVNDGSSDDTNDICTKFVLDNKIPILYINKKNGGKHSAFKLAFQHCKTYYFQCMDDDDIYSLNSVETLLKLWDDVGNNEKIGAIRTLSKYDNGNYVVSGNNIINKLGTYEDCSTLEMNYINNCIQENWTCYKTNALSQIDLFSCDYWLSEKHTFFGESIWQGRFARKFKCRYYYIALRTYTADAPVSIIRSKKNKQHYLNMFINSKIVLDEQFDYISKSLRRLLINVLQIQFLRHHLKISQRDLIKNTKSAQIKLAYWLIYPLSIFGTKVIKLRNK